MSSPTQILLIDDDPIYCQTMKVVLPKLGLQVSIAETPADFLRLAIDHKIGIYMVDLELGKLGSGFELIQKVRKMRGARVPIIVVSGTTATQPITHALEIGATDFIQKPLDKILLASKLSRYVKSAEISTLRETAVTLPQSKSPVKLEFSAQIAAIDELGVHLCIEHLVPKGTVVHLGSACLAGICARKEPILVTVASTWIEQQGPRYGAYAEFDSSDTDLLHRVRIWLAGQAA